MSILTLTVAPSLAAQGKGGGIAIIPLASYALPSTLASEDGGYSFDAKAGIGAGAEIEFSLSKTMGLAIGGIYTFSQDLEATFEGFGVVGSAEITAPRIYGMLSFRPGGRKPNGGVTPLAVQLGGGVTMWTFDNFLVDTDGDGIQETAVPADDWSSSEPFAFAGVAYNIPIGPRATLQLFGRAVGGFGYSSDGLDAFNADPPVSNVEGKFAVSGQFGVGLRIGR